MDDIVVKQDFELTSASRIDRLRGLRYILGNSWDLGFSSFGGANVHFLILHDRFVHKLNWINESIVIPFEKYYCKANQPLKYDELFALNAVTPGSSSTGLLYSIVLIAHGFVPAILAFLIWTFPGAIGMLGVGLGVRSIQHQLPSIVYALLSGLNAATVGLIVLAGVQLAERAIMCQMTRLLVCATACLGLLYKALWYFPFLMVSSGIVMAAHDLRLLPRLFRWLRTRSLRRKMPKVSETFNPELPLMSDMQLRGISYEDLKFQKPLYGDTSPWAASATARVQVVELNIPIPWIDREDLEDQKRYKAEIEDFVPYTVRTGVLVLGVFIAMMIVIMVIRGTVANLPGLFRFFGNIFLAGTIICGGGPVVIPLLADYVVLEGFVSSRDFLIGLAIIQAFPGPNFNFAVFLGTLASQASSPISGALLGYIGIFLPGVMIKTSFLALWKLMRTKPVLTSALKGIECSAVGLIFTAVYRLWTIGLITPQVQGGSALDEEAWFVIVCAASFISSRWFGMRAPVAIIAGGVLGMMWYGAVGRHR